jgi:hypothetical protein
MNAQSTFRLGPRHFALLFFGAALLVCCGCASSLLQLPSNGVTSRLTKFVKGDSQDENSTGAADDFATTLETPVLGDYISVQGNTLVPLRGVGLVVNLNGTGGNPPPSKLQTALRQEMARRDIPTPSKILANPNTALVVVTAYLPANVRKGQPFDARVLLPANTNATSLKGGYLLATRMFEETEIRGHGARKGHEYALTEGPVLTAFGASNDSNESQGLLARGSIPGGAISSTDRELEIVLRKRFQSIRKSKQIADAITARFQRYDRFGRPESQAEAKTNALIKLKPHPIYRNNFPRFHHVIRNIPLAENEVARRLRMEALSQSLLNPATSALAAVRLEAIGNDAKPFLRTGLDSPHAAVRFFAAEGLAYLQDSQDPAGVEVLKVAARDEPAFRVYALAALSIMDTAQSMLALRELLSAESLEARYGAVRAIAEIDDHDRSLNTIHFENRFTMRQIKSNGSPAVHLARRRSPEVTIFGVDQQLLLPAVLNAGHRIRVIGHDGDESVEVSRYRIGEETVRRTCSRRLVDIIRTAGELEAAYPDIVQFLIEAERQDNLPGELGIDRLPQGGRSYLPQTDENEMESAPTLTLGTSARTPGIFDRTDDDPVEEKSDTPDLTTFKNPSAGTRTTAADAEVNAESDPPEPSKSERLDDTSGFDSDENDQQDPDNPESDHPKNTSGVFRRLMKNPFGQHTF